MSPMMKILFPLVTILVTNLALTLAQSDSFPKPECLMEVDSCETLNRTACLGTTLPYTSSNPILANDSQDGTEIIEKLGLWAGLINVPKCWEVVQPFLCAVYMPRCLMRDNRSYIALPGQELCEQTRGPCKVVEKYSGWPDFLQCHQDHFPRGCSSANPVTSLRFNITSTCELPLVPTDNKNSWYQDVDGCGVQCENPLFTKKEHDQIHTFIAVFGSLCMASTLFTVLSFVIDWKNSSRYPGLILFFINACFFIGSVGWMAQFVPGARKDIVCRSDNTMRISEPQLGSGETASCTVIFILVYYFMMAGVTWFVILAYAWHLTFRALGYPRDAIEGKRGHFHLVAWSLPLVLTIVCLALTQVDGDSVSGICFVGYLNHSYRGFFVLLPIGLVMVIGFGFLISGLVRLIKIRADTPGLISDRASAKIRDTIVRLGIFSLFALVFIIVTFIVHSYIFINEPYWKQSFEEYIICEANVTVARSLTNRTTSCSMKSRPNLLAMEIHIFAYFGAGIVMSSWAWNKATLCTWKRFLKKRFSDEPEEKNPVKLRKHEVIAQAFNKRTDMNDGRISLSFYSVHDDPVGMKFDMNSVSSMEMSSAWAAALPRMLMRRGGMAVPNGRRYSDSDVQSIQSTSFGPVSGVVMESHSPRRNSMQSHGSQQSHGSHSHSEQEDGHKKKKKKRRQRRGANRIVPIAASTIGSQDQASKAGSIEPASSIVPSSQCTSLMSSVDPGMPPNRVIQADVHNDLSDNDPHEVIVQEVDSDSIHSEDSNFTVVTEKLDEGVNNNNDGEDEDDLNIPSKKSAFKKYTSKSPKQRKSPNKCKQEFTPAMAAAHHHHMSTYSTYAQWPTGMMPPGYEEVPMGAYNYPMTYVPQDFYMVPPGYMPPGAFFPMSPFGYGMSPHHMGNPANMAMQPYMGAHMMPPPQMGPGMNLGPNMAHMGHPGNMPSPHHMQNPGMMTPPSLSNPYMHGYIPSPPHLTAFNPFENMMGFPQKVDPVRYQSNKKTPKEKPEVVEMTDLTRSELPRLSKKFRDNHAKTMSAFRDMKPKVLTSGVDFQKSKAQRQYCSSPTRPSVSSTYHLDRVELEDLSDDSV